MHALRRVVRGTATTATKMLGRSFISTKCTPSLAKLTTTVETVEDNSKWPRKIFSGIQPTGSLHLGNYLGAVRKWTQLQNEHEDVTYCIVDLHSITIPQNPVVLRENIFQMAATMIACGINPDQSTIFVQSAVQEHTQLGWILNCMTTMARLGHLPQYKEKTRLLKDIPLGLFVYPVLQAADIMLYKATHVPVGEDQVQHIQLAQHLARTFNNKYGTLFPICHAVIDNKETARIRSLRDPNKKMSKSDLDSRATINIMDEPEVIVEKFKKAMTDFTSDVSYQPAVRPGVSNLVAIYAHVTGQPIKKIVDEAKSMNTGQFKLRVADAVVEHLSPVRQKVQQQLQKRNELIYLLEVGAAKARETALHTMSEVAQRMGFGAVYAPVIPMPERVQEVVIPQQQPAAKLSIKNLLSANAEKTVEKPERPVVPKQQLRVEKKMKTNIEIVRVDIDPKMAQAQLELKAAQKRSANPDFVPSEELKLL